MKNPVFWAVDTCEVSHAIEMATQIAPHVGGIKLGLEFFCACGPDGVRTVVEATDLPLFLDLKFHDIPNTVAGALRSVMPLRPAVLTVHAQGGPEMLRIAASTAREAAREGGYAPPRVVAVTVLTSLDDDDLSAIGSGHGSASLVPRLVALARDSGLDGVVCSAREVAAAKAVWPEGYFVVPGIRPQGSGSADQKRVMTPQAALVAGASALVIGRPISAAPDPAAAAAAIAGQLTPA